MKNPFQAGNVLTALTGTPNRGTNVAVDGAVGRGGRSTDSACRSDAFFGPAGC